MQKIVVASGNKNKIKEIRDILKGAFEVVSMTDIGYLDEIDETGVSFEENSYLKAKAVFDFCRLPTLAEDSGLEVEALDGAPGIYSARYSGTNHTDEKNIDLLLKNLENERNRAARFVTVATLIRDNDEVITARGETTGYILTERAGKGGFGYDPVFFSNDLKKSFGEASMEEKAAVSHRSRALASLLQKLQGDKQ